MFTPFVCGWVLPVKRFMTGVATSPPAAARRPLRVVHVLTVMNRGGIETWLMQVLRRQDPAQVQYELLLLSEETGAYDEELRALGIPVRRCPRPGPRSLLSFARCLFATLKRGRYDVVHSHVHQFSGVVLAFARLVGVPGRLAHSHYDSRPLDRTARWPRQLYRLVMTSLIGWFASEGVAVSRPAAAALFGAAWQRQARRRVMPLGLDAQPYRAPSDPVLTRQSLGIAPSALVVGHVGWFSADKNHEFLLRVFARIAPRRSDARLLLIGMGDLMDEVRAQALALGLGGAVIFAGSRSDVPELLQCLDVFVFPSRQEGLGLALIEAQMAGVPCVTAAHLPAETHLPGSQLTALALEAGAEAWAAAVLEAASRPHRFPTENPFDLTHSMTLFTERYEQYRQ